MSNIFINRNRSQGAYGEPIVKQKFSTTDQFWSGRAKKQDDAFYKTSNKFGPNIDYNPKHVSVGWSLADSCDVIKKGIDPNSKKPIPFDDANAWKFYNSFEKQDHMMRVKDKIR